MKDIFFNLNQGFFEYHSNKILFYLANLLMMKIPIKIMIPEMFFSCIWISVSLEKFGFHKPNDLIIVDRNHFWPAGSVTLRFQEVKKIINSATFILDSSQPLILGLIRMIPGSLKAFNIIYLNNLKYM
jgi:hypothetical protein